MAALCWELLPPGQSVRHAVLVCRIGRIWPVVEDRGLEHGERTKNQRRLSGEKEEGEPFPSHRALADSTRHAENDDPLSVQIGTGRPTLAREGGVWIPGF